MYSARLKASRESTEIGFIAQSEGGDQADSMLLYPTMVAIRNETRSDMWTATSSFSICGTRLCLPSVRKERAWLGIFIRSVDRSPPETASVAFYGLFVPNENAVGVST